MSMMIFTVQMENEQMNDKAEKYKKIAKAIAICMPRTQEEMARNCTDCPYFENCTEDDFIRLPIDLVIDIRDYFDSDVKVESRIQ